MDPAKQDLVLLPMGELDWADKVINPNGSSSNRWRRIVIDQADFIFSRMYKERVNYWKAIAEALPVESKWLLARPTFPASVMLNMMDFLMSSAPTTSELRVLMEQVILPQYVPSTLSAARRALGLKPEVVVRALIGPHVLRRTMPAGGATDWLDVYQQKVELTADAAGVIKRSSGSLANGTKVGLV